MKRPTLLALFLGQFFFSMLAGAAADPRIMRSQKHFDKYLNDQLQPFISGQRRIYKGRLQITNLKNHDTIIDDVVGANYSSHIVLTTTPPNPSQKTPLIEFDLSWEPNTDPSDEEVLFRFTIRPFFGNHGRAKVGDLNAFKEIELISDNRLGYPRRLLKKLTTRVPLATDFGSYDNYSFEGSVALLDMGALTLKEILSTPQAMVSGETSNDLLNQHQNGNLVLNGDTGKLAVKFRTDLPYEEAVQIDPKLPPCYDNAPYSFRYVGQAIIPANVATFKSSTGTFTNLKCKNDRD